ncbi:MAG: sensor histidine kinase [Nitrosopumilus sp.]
MLRIRTVVICIFLLITGMFVVVAMYSVTTSQNFIQQSVGQSSVLLAEDTAKSIEFRVSIKIDKLIDFSKTEVVQKALLESNLEFGELEDIQGYITQQEDDWRSVPKKTITPFMQSLISNELSEDIRKNFVDKINSKTGHSVFTEVFLTNEYGANVAQSGKTTDYRQDDEDWWQKAKVNGISIGKAEYDESAKADIIPIGIKITDKDGNFVGVLKAALSVSSIIQEAEISTLYDETIQVNIVTEEGRLIFSTMPFRFNENISDQSFFNKLQSSQQGGFFVDEGEFKKELVTYSRPSNLQVLGEQDWIIVIKHEIGGAGILSGMLTLRDNMIITSAIIVGIAIGIGIIFSRDISRPITKLTYLAKEIGKENFDAEVDIKGKGEIIQLIKNMQDMGTALKKAKKQKEEFISMITHELKTPLTPIIGFCQALADPTILGTLTPNQQDAVETISKNANRLETIIGDLLDSRRLDMDKIKFNFTEVDVVELINYVINNYKRELELKKIHITISAKPPMLLTTDRVRVEQVLTNIFINSIDFVPKDTGKISVRAKLQADSILFTIQDNGPGIPPEEIDNIFKPFSQIDTALTRKHGGAGLGLALCRALVAKLGGKIWVKSELGKGTTFYFTISQKAAQMDKSE